MSITTDFSQPQQPEIPPDVVAQRDGESTQAAAGRLWVVGMPHVLCCLVLAVLFAFANYVSLRPTDLWCHVAYGQWIVEHATLPVEDPFLPLAEGVDVMDLAWLAQWMVYELFERGGPEALSAMFAFVTFSTFATLGRVYFLQTRRIGLATLGIVLTLAIGWSRLWTVRPETFGALCFALLFWMLVSRGLGKREGRAALGATLRTSWVAKLALCLLFVAWANLHGSFACGLVVLGCCWLGQVLRVGLRTRSLRAVWKNRTQRQWLVVGELAVFSCLINPYGMRLLVKTLLFGGHENLNGILEWQPLALTGIGGIEFAISWVLLTIVLRLSRRRVRPAEVLMLGIFAVAAAARLRMLTWYAPAVVFVLIPHLAEIARRYWPRSTAGPITSENTVAEVPAQGLSPAARRSAMFGMACCLVFWVAFALSPSGSVVLGGNRRSDEQLYRQSPLGASDYLRQHPPEGQVWNPQHWGDWLLIHVPGDYSVFSTTMIHHVPPQVWRDYNKVYHAMPTWESVLDRYRVTTVLVDRQSQPQLAPTIRYSPKWLLVYEDEQALVLTRVVKNRSQPAPTPPASGNAAAESDPGDALPASHEMPPSDTGPSDTGPSEATSSDTAPGDADPSDADPSDADPSDADPSDAAAGDAGPAQPAERPSEESNSAAA